MRRYHVKVVLLSLGIVLGFGSAIARHYHHRHHPEHGMHGRHGWHDCDWDGAWDERASAPASPAPQQAPQSK